MSDRRYKLIGSGLPGKASFKVGDLTDGQTVEWNAVTEKWDNVDESGRRVDVKSFGAIGDGVADDTAAINAAIASLGTVGGIAYFPPGIYLVGVEGVAGNALAGEDMLCIELTDNVTLLGEGSATEIRLAPQAGAGSAPYPVAYAVWSGTMSTAKGTVKTVGRRNIAIRRMLLDCDVDVQPSGGTHDISNIRIGECSFIRVQDCELVGGVAETCYLLGKHIDEPQTYFTFTNNHVHDTGEFGVDALGVHMDRINGAVCNDNIFQNIGLRAVGLGKCSDVTVVGNWIGRTYDGGVRIAGGDNIVVASNRIKDANKYGIEVFPEGSDDCTDINIHNNQIEGNSVNGNAGIYVVNGANINITGNSINQMKWDGTNPAAFIAGIHIRSQSGARFQNLTVSHNQIRGIDPAYSSGLTIAPTAIYIEGQVADNTLMTGVAVFGNVVDDSYNGYHYRYMHDYGINGNVSRNITNSALSLTDVTGTNFESGSTTAAWGSVTGTLSAQTDLQTALDGKVDDAQVLTNVPPGAVFTDTVYNDTTIQAAVALNTAKVTDVAHPLVETAVPVGAVFTDTVYTLPFTDNSANWNTAYGWGDHGVEGYATTTDLAGYVPVSSDFSGDADTLKANQHLRVNNTATNMPFVSYWTLVISGNGINVVSQLATTFNTGIMYSRSFNAAWSTWRRVWSDADFSLPLQLTGGTLSGNITLDNGATDTPGFSVLDSVNNTFGYMDMGSEYIRWVTSYRGAAGVVSMQLAANGSNLSVVGGITAGGNSTITGDLTVQNTDGLLTIRDDNNSGVNAAYKLAFDDASNVERGSISSVLGSDTLVVDSLGAVSLNYIGATKLITTSIGTTTTGSSRAGDGATTSYIDYAGLYTNRSLSYIRNSHATGSFYVNANTQMRFRTVAGLDTLVLTMGTQKADFYGDVDVVGAISEGGSLLTAKYARLNAANLYLVGRQSFETASGAEIQDAGAIAQGLEVYQATSGWDAVMQFHIAGEYAVHFGLDSTTNKLAVGGHSMGAVSHALYHEGNKPTLDDLTGTAANSLLLGGVLPAVGDVASTVVKRGTSGDVYARLFRSTFADTAAVTAGAAIMMRVNNSTDSYLRPITQAGFLAEVTAGVYEPINTIPSSGDWWSGGYSKVNTDGTHEIGKYLDWHATDADVTDNTYRMTNTADDAMTFSGSLTVNGDLKVSGTSAVWSSGTGTPEAVVTAPVGSMFTRTDGGTGTTLYVKETGTGNTGWVAK